MISTDLQKFNSSVFLFVQKQKKKTYNKSYLTNVYHIFCVFFWRKRVVSRLLLAKPEPPLVVARQFIANLYAHHIIICLINKIMLRN